MAAFQPNLPEAPLGGFGGMEEVKGFLERDSQSTDHIDVAQSNTQAEVSTKTGAKAKNKKEVKVSGTTIKNTSKRARGASESSTSKKRMSSESAKGKATGRRSPWINN
ncbi:hypothetical protein D1872_293140 [compost metagenome]